MLQVLWEIAWLETHWVEPDTVTQEEIKQVLWSN